MQEIFNFVLKGVSDTVGSDRQARDVFARELTQRIVKERPGKGRASLKIIQKNTEITVLLS